ncbi:MAG: alpha/beta fold hydrolase [Nanoarchaeota archaeon]
MEKKRFMKFLIRFILIVIIIFLGFKLYLYIKFLIGNDLVIQLNSDYRDIFLVYGQSKVIDFKISKVTSPFCKTECEYLFFDVSNNVILNSQKFNLGQASQKKEEIFFQNKLGNGQEMYRFGLTCKNIKTSLCSTDELPVSKDILITIEYGPNQQQQDLAKNLSAKIYFIYNETSQINSTLNYFQSRLNEFNQTLSIDDNFTNLINISQEIINNFSIVNSLWQKGDYNAVNKSLEKIVENENELLSNFIYVNKSIYSKINQYNDIVNSIKLYYQNLSTLSNREMNESDALILNSIIEDFNSKVDSFSKNSSLDEKVKIASTIFDTNFSNLSISNGTFKVNNTLRFNLTQIVLNTPTENFANFNLNNPVPECCVYNVCKACGRAENAYPIIFIHGHDFNKDISAEYSLNVFQNLQIKLDSEGFLNAGQLTIYDLDSNISGILGLSGVPITVRSTYYYDVLKESGSSYLPVQTKSENIDTYSIMLKTLVDKLKYETGQPKVVIISHSMGGVVARRYIQLFGNDSVDKLILISAPNNGIEGNIVSICSVFGAESECTDMTSGSLFFNKLNNYPSPNVKTYNIIGTGCPMTNGMGDGIVLNDNAILNNSKQYYIEGTCSGINLLHGEILKIEKYPEVYTIVKNILQGRE